MNKKMIKRIIPFSIALALIIGVTVSAHATLTPNYELIYDTDLNIYWLQNANLAASNTFGVSGIYSDGRMTWDTAQTWIAAMNTANYLGFSDWRLPTTLQPDPSCNTAYSAYNCTGSEMGHLFYTELGNKGYVAADDTIPQPGWGLTNTGPFFSIQPYNYYWSGTESSDWPNAAWVFGFSDGGQGAYHKTNIASAWAVRDGDSHPVPEPATLFLLGSGMAGMIVWRKKLGRQQG
ncbi:MAG: DUF1566 domain-containing protein [Nitrospirae bacterium]|nr:DUF1566 domain-containing protein [Nitrospirota bacterium]